MPGLQSARVGPRARSPFAGLTCPLVWLALARTVAAQDERRVPAPRVDPGLVLQSDTKSDRGPRLEPIGGGRLRHRDSRFTAIIAPDGNVEFRDVMIKPETKVLGFDLLRMGKLDPPKPIARDNFEERALFPHAMPCRMTLSESLLSLVILGGASALRSAGRRTRRTSPAGRAGPRALRHRIGDHRTPVLAGVRGLRRRGLQAPPTRRTAAA